MGAHSSSLYAHASTSYRSRIDVHQHIVPPFWSDALDALGGTHGNTTGWKRPSWSIESAIAFQNDIGIGTGILSLTTPGLLPFNGEEKRTMARRVNEFTQQVVESHPTRFGHFATLPLPDVEGALIEVAYAFDVLKADGIVLLSNYEGIYLGDPSFAPLWDELDRRNATVFVHPARPLMASLPGMPAPMIDFLLDTVRSAVQLVQSGVIAKCANVNIILSHAGGFVPYAADRFAQLATVIKPDGPTADESIALYKRFYFDTALSSGYQIPSLLGFADHHHILYGSDFPYAPASIAAELTRKLDNHTLIDESMHNNINRNNAMPLFPRIAQLSK